MSTPAQACSLVNRIALCIAQRQHPRRCTLLQHLDTPPVTDDCSLSVNNYWRARDKGDC